MSTTMEDPTETAVRNYLLFLEDPSKLIDEAQIDGLKQRAVEASDPIERLRAYTELERAQRTDDSKVKLDFILHAKTWAQAHDIEASAFRQLGVKDDVLRSAGLLGGTKRGRKPSRSERGATRGSVSAEVIKQHVRGRRGTFTLADLSSDVGGSPMTVRKAVQELVSQGTVRRLGPAKDWTGRGRAPIVFEVG
jgi:hypothetical protein